jgi:hypothetical protein
MSKKKHKIKITLTTVPISSWVYVNLQLTLGTSKADIEPCVENAVHTNYAEIFYVVHRTFIIWWTYDIYILPQTLNTWETAHCRRQMRCILRICVTDNAKRSVSYSIYGSSYIVNSFCDLAAQWTNHWKLCKIWLYNNLNQLRTTYQTAADYYLLFLFLS